MTKVMFCDCKHNYQDKKYGSQMRVWNEGVKGWKCTVCGKIKSK
jgi:hypothetical protein